MKTLIATLLITFQLQGASQSTADPAMLIRYDRNKTAADHLHKNLSTDPGAAEHWYLLAKTYANLEKVQDGIDTLKMAPTSVTEQPYYQVAMGMLLLENGNVAAAEQYFESALNQTKRKNATILAAVADAHISAANGNYQLAVGLLDRAISRDKKNANLHILKGNAYRKLQQGSEAYKSYQEALAKDAVSAEANYQLGLIFLTQNNNELVEQYLGNAINFDPNDPRPLYSLYRYHFASDPAKSLDYFQKYLSRSDQNIKNEFALSDLMYLNKRYSEAIKGGIKLLDLGDEPRLFKLLAYSYLGLRDSATGRSYMERYFRTEADSNFVAKDFETMATLYMSDGRFDSAIFYQEKLVSKTKDHDERLKLYKNLASLAKSAGDPQTESKWLETYYKTNQRATNVDLFNWGLATFKAKDFVKADSVFSMYTEKYPEQGFGYYWRAKSNAEMDPEMKEGLAVPIYTSLISLLKSDTSGKINKPWMIEAFAYLAAYEANVNNNYAQAVSYFKELLNYDPNNKDAENYISILEKRIQSASGSD